MPTIRVDDLEIHYEDQGQGFPLLLLHGLGNNSQSWRNQLEELSPDFRVIAWDAPGYGGSSDPPSEYRHFREFAHVLNRFVEELGLEEIYILGHSMGSAVAIEMYQLAGEKIKALILADATRGSAGLDPIDNQRKLTARLEMIDTLTGEELAKQRAKNLLAPNPDPAVLREAERIMAMVRPKGYRSVSYSLASLNQMDIYASIKVPTLIIYGELDNITPVNEGRIIHEHIKNSQFVLIPNTGHLCYQENPELFNQMVRRFLQEQQ